MSLAEAKILASCELDTASIPDRLLIEAILIRSVEELLLELFAQGRLNGTVHTCVGQEFCAVAIAGALNSDDWITSNHRCHGHFLSKTKDWRGLLGELMGLCSGVCRGVGSSQHLYAQGFISNGVQGSLVPVGTGIAMAKKVKREDGIVVSFIGEGTFGEGIVYETLNLSSILQVRQLIVCENNFYSQSTPQSQSLAGSISERAKAFGLRTFEADTWDLRNLFAVANEAIAHVRGGAPAFLLVKTYRLNAHSKGDDDRDLLETAFFQNRDPVNRLLQLNKFAAIKRSISEELRAYAEDVERSVLKHSDYSRDQLPRSSACDLAPVENAGVRMGQALNAAYKEKLKKGAFFIGEDIVDPYGGAFKITKGLSTINPQMVVSSPISEGGLVGVAIGMASQGVESFAEIMFGDFITLAMDQVINNASKMHHMYAGQMSVPVRIRTPMGGKRGYGPTHSQSLEKHLLGIDNLAVIYLSSLCDPSHAVSATTDFSCPFLVLENKVDYGRQLWQDTNFFKLRREAQPFGALLLSPTGRKPSLTIVSYGETARHLADNIERFFEETDEIGELVSLTLLHPLDLSLVLESLKKTKRILVVEDGSIHFGFGGELLALLVERGAELSFALRVGAEPVPIPSVTELESRVLPTIERVIHLFQKSQTITA